jgi:hypothetical protein
MPLNLSECCNAKVRVASSSPTLRHTPTTNWYICTLCNQPCNLIGDKEDADAAK